MLKKLLNVGKGQQQQHQQQQQQQQQQNNQHQNQQQQQQQHQQQHNQQQQQQQKNLFQLNEIRSYGFSHLCCLGYSPSLSLLAVGSKHGLLRVLGNPSVEFSCQLEPASSIRQVDFVDCRSEAGGVSGRLVALTENGQLHLLELRSCKQQNFADNTTQTESACCQVPAQQAAEWSGRASESGAGSAEFTILERVGQLDYFEVKPEEEDRSKRVTTFELSADGQVVFVGTEGGNLYQVPFSKFEPINPSQPSDKQQQQQPVQENKSNNEATSGASATLEAGKDEVTALNLSDEPKLEEASVAAADDEQPEEAEPFEMVKFEKHIASELGEEVKSKKQGPIESIKRHPASAGKLLISYHRGLSVIYCVQTRSLERYFYHNQVLECSCFADQTGDFFYTSHNDGSYVKWDTRQGSQAKANEDLLSLLYGPYPCKPTPKIQACTGLVSEHPEELVIFSGGMPRATYDDKNPVTIVHAASDGKSTIKTVLDFTSKVLDFALITRPRASLGAKASAPGGAGAAGGGGGGGGGKKNKHKQQQQQQKQQQQHNQQPIAVALAILAEEEFVVIDLLNSESYLEFALPYLNCIHSSAITCNQHYSDISDQLYDQLLAYNKQQLKGKLSANEWPIQGGKVIEAPVVKAHDILLTGHEDGSVDIWDVSDLAMRHLLHLSTASFFSTSDEADETLAEQQQQQVASAMGNGDSPAKQQDPSTPTDQQDSGAWPPLKRVGRFDPFSDDTRLAIRMLSLCPQTGTLVVAGTGGQVLLFELRSEQTDLHGLEPDEISIVADQRFTWKGRDKLRARQLSHKQAPGYQLASYVQLDPPVAATALDLRADWRLYALGTSYGFYLYDYAAKRAVLNRCTLNVQDFAIVSGDAAGAISRKKSFRKSLRESFRRLRRGRSQRNQPTGAEGSSAAKPATFGRLTTGVRTLGAPSAGANQQAGGEQAAPLRQAFSAERQVEVKVELSSIVKCLSLSAAIVSSSSSFKPTLWVGTNSGQVLVYTIELASEQQGQQEAQTSAKLAKEIQLKHKAPIVAIFTSPEAPASEQHSLDTSAKSSPEKSNDASSSSADHDDSQQQQQQQVQPQVSAASGKSAKEGAVQPRVLICSEEQFKVFNLPNLKPFCKFKLTAHEGLRAKKISITQFMKPAQVGGAGLSASKSLQSFATQTSAPSSPLPPAAGDEPLENGHLKSSSEHNNNSLSTLNNNHTAKELMNAKFGAKTNNNNNNASQASGEQPAPSQQQQEADQFEPYMVCMSNQGDCAIYSVPELKRQAQIQVCRREDVNGITSTMLTNYGEGFYLKSSSNFLRFSISSQRVLRVLSLV